MVRSFNFMKKWMHSRNDAPNQSDVPTKQNCTTSIAQLDHKQFTVESLTSATNNFNPKNKLGEGGFGPVYKGKLPDKRDIAVKKLSALSKQGRREFEAEAKLLASVQHRNVVSLYGYCSNSSQFMLVYEYVHNKSLDKFLFYPVGGAYLTWQRRLAIIAGIAKGLLYLHDYAHKRIIHRDIKASNVLLDDKFSPKIADFGLARLFPEDQTHVNTHAAGTNGYMAPEYAMRGNLSEKVDVYSFGVLVLEIVSGKRNSSFLSPENDCTLLEWAYECFTEGRVKDMVDANVGGAADAISAETCVHIGLLCTQSDPHSRPDMTKVSLWLAKKPSHLEQPTRPVTLYGSRHRTSKHPTWTSSGRSGSSYSTTTASEPHLVDPRGKRPVVG